MQMRLGKTLVTIRWLEAKADARKILVVCPLSVIESWRMELEKEGIELVSLRGTYAQRAKILEKNTHARWYAINYEGINERGHKTASGKSKAIASDFAELPWDAVVADESTYIRSPRAQRTKVFLSTLTAAKYKVLLSGLPNPEGPEDFVTQFLFLHGEFMGCKDFWSWRQAYCQPCGHDWLPRGKTLGLIRAYVHERAYVLSRKEAGIGNIKVREQRMVELPAIVHAALRSAAENFEIGDKLTTNILETITWQSRLVGGRFPENESFNHEAKFRELLSLMKGELKGEKVVVWCRFTAEILRAAEVLSNEGISVSTITAASREKNPDRIRKFQAGKIQVLVAQPKCIQMGIDLSIADTAIYLSNYLDFEIRAQSEDRIEHPMKKQPLLIIDIVAKDTIDEDFVRTLENKSSDAQTMLKNFMGLIRKRISK